MDDNEREIIQLAHHHCAEELALLDRVLAEEPEPPPEPLPPWEDHIAEMPVNRAPDHPDLVKHKWKFWPERALSDITGITIHHTCSHSPLALTRWITRPQSQGGKGYPSTQYALWVSAGDGCPIWLHAPLEWGIWHDHTGAHQTTISIGMAGTLHVNKPPQEQIDATARLCAYLMNEFDIPVSEIQGHGDRAKAVNVYTVCPGWYAAGWVVQFQEALRAVL